MARRNKAGMADLPPGQSNPLDYAVTSRDHATLDMVRAAITHKQVMLAYQPVMTAQDPMRPAFYEGLIRVLDETGRVIPAKDFMSAVATDDLGRQLDCLALELSLATLIRQPQIRLSVNMSARSIGYKRWNESMRRGLARKPDIGARLILEISEDSALTMPELVLDFMDEQQPKGIAFALDDFGAGLTSFRHFKEFFFDILKLDGQFSHNIQHDTENQSIAGAIAAIARQFDMYSVASRVENPEDAATLAALGFDCLQGFLFGAPSVSPPWKKAQSRTSAA